MKSCPSMRGRARASGAAFLAAAWLASAAAPTCAQTPDAVGKGACMTCHAVDKKVVGPAFQAVARKYRSDGDARARIEDSIRKGSAGRWGTIPMPPNSALKDDDVKALSAWIVSL